MTDAVHEQVREENDEQNESLSSLFKALTEGPPSLHRREALTLTTSLPEGSTDTPRTESPLLSRDEVGALLARPDLPIGIDCLAASFDVGALLVDDPVLWTEIAQKGVSTRRYVTTFPLGQGSVFVSIHRNIKGSWGYVEVKPATVLYGKKTTQLANPKQALEVFHSVMDEVAQIVQIRTSRPQTRLSRVDLTVDVHNVSSRQDILTVAQRTPYRAGLKTCTYTGSKGHESVTCRTKKSGGFSVYDKSLQAKAKGSIVRFEVETRRRLLKKVCPTVGDLSPERCGNLFRQHLGPLIGALRATPRTDIDNILADRRQRKVFIEALGISVLRDRGYMVEMTDYWWKKAYRPFKKAFPHFVIGDLLGNMTPR